MGQKYFKKLFIKGKLSNFELENYLQWSSQLYTVYIVKVVQYALKDQDCLSNMTFNFGIMK